MKIMKRSKRTILKGIFLLLTFFSLTGVLSAQMEFPAGDFWSLNFGLGMSNFLVKGQSFQAIIDPKIWLTPSFMVGAKAGFNYSFESNSSNPTLGDILTLEGQVYARWNFLRFGYRDNPYNVFAQFGIGLVAAYRGTVNPFWPVTETRGSALADAAFGISIPLTERWYIEPSFRTGYPHLWGISVTAGYKFPLPKNKTTVVDNYINTYTNVGGTRTEYVEILRMMPANEIIRRIMISAVEFILFGPDIGRYNIGIDADARQLNELVLNQTAHVLLNNPNTIVRIEGHVNPYTINHYEVDELNVLSLIRANTVAEELRRRGVPDEQMVVIAFGGSRTVTNEFDLRNRNRRVELIIVLFDTE